MKHGKNMGWWKFRRGVYLFIFYVKRESKLEKESILKRTLNMREMTRDK